MLRDSRVAARAARLRYVRPGEHGIVRQGRPKHFIYRDQHGRRVRDARTLARIAKLAIPPAWTDVWICGTPDGHVQATGRDARGRKQYRYHPDWRTLRDRAKYHGVVPFGHALPKLRRQIARDLARPKLDRHKVTAIALKILDETGIRIGNDEYARINRSFGLTTLMDGHAKISGKRLELAFVGKGGRRHRVEIHDRELANLVQRCRDVPGQRLFQYFDEHGHRRALGSADVNRYLAEATGQPFTAKEFRTWHACVSATLLLAAADGPRAVNQVMEQVALGLGNTVAVCKKCYVHPTIVDAYLAGELHHALELAFAETQKSRVRGLRPDEAAVLDFLEQRLSAPQALAA